jgi:hypothetical protein
MLRPAFVLLLFIGMLVPIRGQELHLWGQLHPWGQELKPIFEVLQKADLAGSVELAGRCGSALPGFPQFGSAPTNGSSPLAALRAIAANDQAMQVKQDRDGTIRMREKGVPTDILSIRISHILFEDFAHHEIYSASFAAGVILSAPEVVAYAKVHNIALHPWSEGIAAGVGAGYSQRPPGAPHISGSLDNVTVLEALNHVLGAFPGQVLVYWDCPERQEKNEPKQTTNSGKQPVQADPPSDCAASSDAQSAVLPAGVPNPFCIPRSALSSLPQWLRAPTEPRQRRILLRFFMMNKVGGNLLVGTG